MGAECTGKHYSDFSMTCTKNTAIAWPTTDFLPSESSALRDL